VNQSEGTQGGGLLEKEAKSLWRGEIHQNSEKKKKVDAQKRPHRRRGVHHQPSSILAGAGKEGKFERREGDRKSIRPNRGKDERAIGTLVFWGKELGGKEKRLLNLGGWILRGLTVVPIIGRRGLEKQKGEGNRTSHWHKVIDGRDEER